MATTAPPASVDPADLDAYRSWAQRRVLRALVITQVFGGAGLAACVSVGAVSTLVPPTGRLQPWPQPGN